MSRFHIHRMFPLQISLWTLGSFTLSLYIHTIALCQHRLNTRPHRKQWFSMYLVQTKKLIWGGLCFIQWKCVAFLCSATHCLSNTAVHRLEWSVIWWHFNNVKMCTPTQWTQAGTYLGLMHTRCQKWCL